MAKSGPTATQKQSQRVSQILRLLEENRETAAFPLTVEQLAAQLGEIPADTLRLLSGTALKQRVDVAARQIAAPVALQPDRDQLVESPGMLQFLAVSARSVRQQRGTALRTEMKKIAKDAGIAAALQPLVISVITRRQADGTLPVELRALLLPPPAELAVQLVQQLRAHQDSTATVQPLAQVRLFELAECTGFTTIARKAVRLAEFTTQVAVCVDGRSKDPSYILRSSLRSATPALVRAAFEQLVAKSNWSSAKAAGTKSKRTTLFASKTLAGGVLKDRQLHPGFAATIEALADQGALGAEVAWLYDRGERRFFRLVDLEPARSAAARPTSDARAAAPSGSAPVPDGFAGAFEAAFRRIDECTGARNLVKVLDLRRALPQYDRAQFEAGLRELRLANRYTMTSSHGGIARLTEEELEAGIREGISLLVYVSRK